MGGRHQEHVALTVACAFVYHQIVGDRGRGKTATDLDRILNDVAHALSNVAPIYAEDDTEAAPRALEPIELLQARFERAATRLKTSAGVEHQRLTIRRADMRAAVEILKRAGARFRA